MRKWVKGATTTPKIITWPTEEDYKEMNRKLGLNNITISQPLTLRISERCHWYIRELHMQYPNKEWLAICKTEQVWPWIFELVDMIHPEQTASTGSVTATDKGMDWSVDYLMEKGEDLSKWNLILHSHHSMWVFWSSTDDNARLWYNDGRFMCWAVVTAYDRTAWAESGKISYKGCVNFYKPYNIEIDCVVEQPERDLRKETEEYLNLDKKYQAKLEENKKDIFRRLVEESIPTINTMSDQVDYTRIIEYLGIDITSDLIKNYEIVSTKIPNPEVSEFLKLLEKQAEEKAKEETPQEEKAPSQEITDFIEWAMPLEEQLKKAFETGETSSRYKSWTEYSKSYKNESLFPTAEDNRKFNTDSHIPSSSTSSVIEEDWYDDYDYDKSIYNKRRYPTIESLRDEINIPEDAYLFIDQDWIWEIYCKETQTFEYIEDRMEIMGWFGASYSDFYK